MMQSTTPKPWWDENPKARREHKMMYTMVKKIAMHTQHLKISALGFHQIKSRGQNNSYQERLHEIMQGNK